MSPNPVFSRSSIALLVATVGCLSIVPISSDELWWQLSRGRAVIDGTIAPSQQLLAADSSREADWLSGVPFYVVHHVAGISGLMALKFAALAGFALMFWNRLSWYRDRDVLSTAAFAVTFVCLLAIADAAEPTPLMFDTLALLLLDRLARRWLARPSWINTLAVAGLFLAWSNLARLPVLGLLSLMIALPLQLAANGDRPNRRHTWRLIAIATLTVCVTPRGWFTVSDSIRLLLPWTAAPLVVVQQFATWQPLLQRQWGLPETAFVVLTAAGIVILFNRIIMHRDSHRQGLLFLLGQFTTWTSTANLAPGAVLTTLAIVDLWPVLSHDRVPPTRIRSWWRHVWWQRTRQAAVVATASLVLLGRASGWLPNCPNRLGWGLVPRLDPTPLRQALDQVQLDGAAHCVGIRGAGMISWIRPNGVNAVDVPHRALLGNRLVAEAALNRDLRHGREFSYRRVDGSTGGWWIPLQHRDTALLLIDDQHTNTIRQLCGDDESIWRPFSLQSSVVPFGRAGDDGCSQQIIETLRFEQFLTWAAPAAAPISNSGSETHWDLWGSITKKPDPSASIRQARLLNAMQLHVPALRLLAPVLSQTTSRAARAEFATGQLWSAYHERLEVGQASQFRSLAYWSTADNSLGHKVPAAYALLQNFKNLRELHPAWLDSNSHYTNGAPPPPDTGRLLVEPTARSVIDAEFLYAQGWRFVESGQLAKAVTVFEHFLETYPDHRFSRLVRRNIHDAREFL